jgi:hypothetical protein
MLRFKLSDRRSIKGYQPITQPWMI